MYNITIKTTLKQGYDMKRDNVIHLEDMFKEFQANKLKWTVLGKQYHRFTIYQRCQEMHYKIKVYKSAKNNIVDMTKLRVIEPADFKH